MKLSIHHSDKTIEMTGGTAGLTETPAHQFGLGKNAVTRLIIENF